MSYAFPREEVLNNLAKWIEINLKHVIPNRIRVSILHPNVSARSTLTVSFASYPDNPLSDPAIYCILAKGIGYDYIRDIAEDLFWVRFFGDVTLYIPLPKKLKGKSEIMDRFIKERYPHEFEQVDI